MDDFDDSFEDEGANDEYVSQAVEYGLGMSKSKLTGDCREKKP